MNDIHIPAFTIRKKIVVGIIFFVAGAFLFAAFSTIATTIGTNVSVTGHLFATSTVQATGNIVGYADLIMGTTTPWKGASFVFEQQAGTQPVFLVGDMGTSTPHFMIDAKGWVGIGTASPSRTLDIVNSNAVVRINNTGTDTGFHAMLILDAMGTGTNFSQVRYSNQGTGYWATGLDPSDSNNFKIGNGINVITNTKLTITTGGNVGIGTTSPASLLSLSSSGTTTVHIGTTSTTKGSCFQMYDAAHVAYRAFISKAGAWTVEAGTCE